jgi:hypothetical protein
MKLINHPSIGIKRKFYVANHCFHYIVTCDMKLNSAKRLMKIILLSAEHELRGKCDEKR